MDVACLTPILNVSDMAASFAWFETLGWKKLWDWGTPPTFGAVGSGKVEIFLCLGAQGSRGGPMPKFAGGDETGGVWMSWFLGSPAEVDAAHALALQHGKTVTHPPTDEPWGVREFHLRHPDGHTFRVGAGLCEYPGPGRAMLPPLIADAFRSLPADLIAVCRPHSWEELTAAPGDALRSVRDILVHLMENEAGWISHVVRGEPRRRFDPAAFDGLDAILSEWGPLRAASVATVLALSDAERSSRRPLPWDKAKTVSVEEVVWHVVGHDQYHSGQVFTRLALLGRRNLPDHDLIRVT